MLDINDYGDNPPHVGHFVIRIFFDKKFRDGRVKDPGSVAKAAQMLKVGRNPLMSLLKGRSSLSTAMAARIEDVFRFRAEELLVYQAKWLFRKYRKEVGSEILPVYNPR